FTIEEIHRPRQDSFAAGLRKIFKKHGYDFSIIDVENDNPESIIARNHLRAVLIDIRPRSPAESIRGWFALAHDYPRLAIYRGGDRETEIFLRDEMGFKLKAENGDRTARIP